AGSEDADAGPGSVQQCTVVVGTYRPASGHGLAAASVGQPPVRKRREALELQAVVRSELGGLVGRTVSLDIGRRCTKNALMLAKPPGHQAAVTEDADPKRRIVALG